MDRHLFRPLAERELAARGIAVSPFSREFLVGRRYLTERTVSMGRIVGGRYGLSLAEATIRWLLTEEERREAFPSAYEIGSAQTLAPGDANATRLAEYLGARYALDVSAVASQLKRLKRDIEDWTGVAYAAHRHADPVAATRTLCLLYRFTKDVYPHLPSLLRNPAHKNLGSHEFRDAYPLRLEGRAFDMAVRNVAVVADLKARLAFGLGDDHEDLKALLSHCLHGKDDRPDIPFAHLVQGYRSAAARTRRLVDRALPPGPGRSGGRLDVELYLYLSVLELEHSRHARAALIGFVDAPASALTLAQPPASDADWLQPWSRALARRAIALAQRHAGARLSCVAANEAIRLAGAILRCSEASSPTLLEYVCALIGLCGDGIGALRYKVWWQGKTEIGDRPLGYLKAYASGQADEDRVPGGYLDFWRLRYRRTLYWSLGDEAGWRAHHDELIHQQARIVEVLRSHPLADAVRIVGGYRHRVLQLLDEENANGTKGRATGGT